MILSDTAILAAIEKGDIVITPFDRECLGSNSYDVHLSEHLAWYDLKHGYLDAKIRNLYFSYDIPICGVVLYPNKLYLASTIEYTETHKHVPFLEGKSSTGRLGISVHATAGKGDVGFCNHWTLEISVIEPVRVYAGMPIAQLIYHTVEGEVSVKYNDKASAKYREVSPLPQGSSMWKNKF